MGGAGGAPHARGGPGHRGAVPPRPAAARRALAARPRAQAPRLRSRDRAAEYLEVRAGSLPRGHPSARGVRRRIPLRPAQFHSPEHERADAFALRPARRRAGERAAPAAARSFPCGNRRDQTPLRHRGTLRRALPGRRIWAGQALALLQGACGKTWQHSDLWARPATRTQLRGSPEQTWSARPAWTRRSASSPAPKRWSATTRG